MIVSSVLGSSLLGAAALMALQPDPTSAPRGAYTGCLRAFMEKSVKDKTTVEAFTAALAQQCSAEEAAFRAAVRAREARFRTPAGEIDQIITGDLEDARDNIRQTFEMTVTPRA